jgi:CshA-type fibril repeat protein
VPFAIALDEGHTNQLSSLTDGADVTGTTVTSDKPVAVLGGAACANVPVGSYACNPLVQQLPPTTAWGTDFVTTRFATRTKGDTYRILADQDATSVSINGAQVAMLDAGEFHETIQPADATTTANDAIVFTASKPVMVAQYGNGQGYDNTTGDPLMMLVTPVGQHLTSYTVATPAIVSSGVEMTPYVNVVVQTRDVGKLTLDGAVVPADQFVSAAGTDYSVAQLQVSTGQHDLTSVHQFGVQVYLWGPYDGLAFPGGSASAPIADANDPPTASPLTSTGQGPRTVTVPVAEQQEVHLLDGSTVVDEVTIAGQGSYVLDPSTGVITFTPEAGFAGAATPVTYRIADAWNQQAESTFTPTVQASPSQVVPAPPAANPRADLQVPKRAIVSPGKAGAVTARCIVRDAMINDCSVTLVARVKGKRTVIGTGVSKATAPGRIRVRLNAVGRSLTASPNGQRTTAQMTVRTTAGQTLHDDATLRVVTRSFTLSRPAYFSSSSTRLAKADRAYLRRVGDAVGTVRRITCTGYTDSSGSERSNKVLGLKRAKAVCAALDLPRGVRVDIVSAGEHRPVAANSGAAGKARNRRATITLHY